MRALGPPWRAAEADIRQAEGQGTGAGDVVLPTTAGRDVKLTCVTRPDKAQAAIIERPGLELPERLGRPRWVRVPRKQTRSVVQAAGSIEDT